MFKAISMSDGLRLYEPISEPEREDMVRYAFVTSSENWKKAVKDPFVGLGKQDVIMLVFFDCLPNLEEDSSSILSA